jgi:GPH family glycoside/pentoside/hexuronide:cation symporter
MSSERLRFRTKIAFGVGAAAEAAVFIAFNTWNFLFYKNVLGLSGTLCGLAVMISLTIDGVSDPVVGFISDRWRSNLGRRHPFLFASAIPLGISFYCIYVPPASLSGFSLFAWFTFFSILFRQSWTLYQVPHLALGAELTNDFRERSAVMAWNSLFGMVGGAATFVFGWGWIRKHGGAAVRDGYPGLAAAVAVFAALSILASAFFTRDQIPRLVKTKPEDANFSLRDLVRDTLGCFENRNYRVMVLGLLFISASVGTIETLGSFMSLFFWGLSETKIASFGLISPFSFVVAFFLATWLNTKFGKRETIVGAAIVSVVMSLTPVLLRVGGVLPPNESPRLLPILLGFYFIYSGAGAVLMISALSALADVADEHELATGRRQEGVFYSSRILFSKLTIGLGHMVAGAAMDLIAFPDNAKPGQVAAEVVQRLGWIGGPMAALPTIVAIFFYARYSLDRQRHAEIQRELAARKLPVVPAREQEQLAASQAVIEQVTS